MKIKTNFIYYVPNLSELLLSILDRNGPRADNFINADVLSCSQKQLIKEAKGYRSYLEYLRETFMSGLYSAALWSIPAIIISVFITKPHGRLSTILSFVICEIVLLVFFISGFSAIRCDQIARRVTSDMQRREMKVVHQNLLSFTKYNNNDFLFWPGWIGAIFSILFTSFLVIFVIDSMPSF